MNMCIKFVAFFLLLVLTVKFSDQCGVPAKSISLIVRGYDFQRGKWPWTVALMQQSPSGNQYICGGVLVSNTKVITAAHCIHEKNSARTKTRDISVLFGIHDLKAQNENGVYSDSPQEILVHPDWNPYTTVYDADIAAMIFEDEIPITRFIRPICLATNDLDLNKGYVTGWGKSEDESKTHETIPKELQVPIWNNERCFLESHQFTQLSSVRTFCAGSRNNSGVCNGDSGGGLFIESNGVFYLKGIVSASLTKANKCDVSNFAIYTNIAKFLSWIDAPSEVTIPTIMENIQEQCGIMSSSAGLIQKGIKSKNVQWPWTVIIFNKAYQVVIEEKPYQDFEVGTLISDKFVIGDGLYFSKKEDGKRVPISTDLIKTYFGVIDLDDYINTHSMVLDGAEAIFLHEILDNDESLKFANFALIKMKSSVTFSQYISPICLSSFDDDPYSLTGRYAYAVGMGYSETGKTKHRLHAPMRIRDKEHCDSIYGHSLNAAGLKNRKSFYFCAGGDGAANACWADHPLYMKFNNKWYLHAFFQVAYNKDKGCQEGYPVLYEVAGAYNQWIMNKMK